MKIMRVVLFGTLLVAVPKLSYAQNGLFFSFKSGFPLSGTVVGLKLGPLAPFAGLDIARVSGSFEEKYTSWSTESEWLGDHYEYGDLYRDYRRESTFDGSLLLIVPHAGARFYLSKFYLIGDMMIVLPSVEGRDKGTRIYYDSDGNIDDFDEWDDKLEKEDKKLINDALDFVVLTAGIGVEFPFSSQFSIGGEYGFRMAMNTFEDSGEESSEDEFGQIRWKDEWEDKISMSLGITYTAFTLNFYF